MHAATIGLDIAKHVFQVHGADAAGKPVLRQRLRRAQVLAFFGGLDRCVVGIEACATAHHWARELQALGHEVRLVPPSYVKAYVKRNKNDAADAEAICEAVTRPTMRFVPVKAREQQAVLMLHRARSLVVAQRRSLGNAVRAHLAEFGVVGPQGRAGLRRLVEQALDPVAAELPDLAREVIRELGPRLAEAEAREAAIEAKILAWHRASEVSRRLATIPGIGHPRHRADHRLRDRGHGTRPGAVRLRPALRRLDRPGAPAAFDRRQGTARPHQQARRRLPAPAAGDRRPGGAALDAGAAGEPDALAGGHAGAAAVERRRHGTGEQDGEDRLGRDGPWRSLPERVRGAGLIGRAARTAGLRV